MLIPQAIVQSGSSLSQSYLGYNTIGGSFESMDAGRAYCKSVTLAADGLVTSIAAHVKGNATNVGDISAVIYTDSAGSPSLLRSQSLVIPSTGTTIFLNATARWLDLPCGAWLTAGTYWIAVYASNVTGASMQLAYDATGADKYVDSDNPWVSDASVAITTGTTVNAYSIRASFLS